MYSVSELWDSIISQDGHKFEVSLVIGESGRLITNAGDKITFGGEGILVAQGGADSGYDDSYIMSLSTSQSALSARSPGVGAVMSAELEATILKPAGDIPRMALVRPYVRVTNGTQTSEWIPQGVFYIDTREYTKNYDGLDLMTLHCFDAMLMTEQDFPNVSHPWPAEDSTVIFDIADALGIGVEDRTWDVVDKGYNISPPVGYSMREVLANIAAMYAGNWILDYDGELLLVALNSAPPETNYLVDNFGYAITFGGGNVTETLTGDMVSFGGDGSDLSALSVDIVALQSGSGDPSPTNVRPIIGYGSAKIHVSPTQTGGTIYDVSFGSAGTVYGGTLNVLTGELTVTRVGQTFLWSAGVSEYAPSGNAFKRRTFALTQTGVAGATHSRMNCIAQYNTGTPTTTPYYYLRANGAYMYAWMPVATDGSAELQVVYDLATPQTYQLTAQQVATLAGQNYVWAECGDVTLTYSSGGEVTRILV